MTGDAAATADRCWRTIGQSMKFWRPAPVALEASTAYPDGGDSFGGFTEYETEFHLGMGLRWRHTAVSRTLISFDIGAKGPLGPPTGTQ